MKTKRYNIYILTEIKKSLKKTCYKEQISLSTYIDICFKALDDTLFKKVNKHRDTAEKIISEPVKNYLFVKNDNIRTSIKLKDNELLNFIILTTKASPTMILSNILYILETEQIDNYLLETERNTYKQIKANYIDKTIDRFYNYNNDVKKLTRFIRENKELVINIIKEEK